MWPFPRRPAPPPADWHPLAAAVGLPVPVLADILATGTLRPHLGYRHFRRPKPAGGSRPIAEPDPRLKRAQRAVLATYLTAEEPHPAAVAYRPGRSVADHVWPHAGAAGLAVADLRDFFPSTRAGRVNDWWRDRTDSDTARLLTLLTTLGGGLPQGAPTSPALSNLVNRPLDDRLARRAAATGGRYTRYSDDLLFSWPTAGGPPAGFEAGLRAVLHEFGYVLNADKGFRVFAGADEPEVTGLVLTRAGGVRLPDRLRRAMRAAADPARVAGYKGYAAMVGRRPAAEGSVG